jgi:hypothetical protein
MDDHSALTMVRATAEPIHSIGSTIYLSPETFGRAAGWGWANPLAFYFAGRGGALGSTDPDVVAAAMGYFNPEVVSSLYPEGIATTGPQGAADRMLEATAAWGRDHLDGVEGLASFVGLADRLVDGAGRAAQLFQILREWRGAAHLVGTTAVGLSPLEAILTNEGPGQAKFFGWPEPFPEWEGIVERHVEAEAITDDLCARDVERTLSPDECREFAAGVSAAAAALNS